MGKLLNTKINLEYFSNVQMLGEPLGKMLCEGLVIFEKRLGILSITNLAHQNQIGFFEVAVMRRVLFTRGFWKKILCWAWDELGRVGAMPPYNSPKIFGNFFGNSEVKMSLNVDNWIC